MLKLWIFWLEILAFCALGVWLLFMHGREYSLTGSQWADAVIYGAGLIYGLYGFIPFVRRRFIARNKLK